MSKYKVCKKTKKFDKLIEALDENNIEYKVKDCVKNCSKCHSSVMIKKDDKYISASNVEKLLLKLDK